MILPPDILLFGHRLSQETKCLELSHLLISVPVSERISKAVISLNPKMAVTSTPRIALRYAQVLNDGLFLVACLVDLLELKG